MGVKFPRLVIMTYRFREACKINPSYGNCAKFRYNSASSDSVDSLIIDFITIPSLLFAVDFKATCIYQGFPFCTLIFLYSLAHGTHLHMLPSGDILSFISSRINVWWSSHHSHYRLCTCNIQHELCSDAAPRLNGCMECYRDTDWLCT